MLTESDIAQWHRQPSFTCDPRNRFSTIAKHGRILTKPARQIITPMVNNAATSTEESLSPAYMA